MGDHGPSGVLGAEAMALDEVRPMSELVEGRPPDLVHDPPSPGETGDLAAAEAETSVSAWCALSRRPKLPMQVEARAGPGVNGLSLS